jgi:hypothetical protein
MINVGAVLWRIKAIIIRGASFCHVARIMQANHDIDVITDGNQKWNGAIPNLIIIADISMKFM